MTKPVGFILFEAALSPILDPQEPVNSLLATVDGADEIQVRQVLQEYVKPYYESFDDQSRETLANSILYFASIDAVPDTMPLDALPTPFELKQDIHVVCVWLTEELGLDSKNFDPKSCEYSENLSLVHRLRRKIRKSDRP